MKISCRCTFVLGALLCGVVSNASLHASEATETGKLISFDAAGNDQFGIAVTIDGSTAAVGSWKDDNENLAAGSAYIFVRGQSGSWSVFKKLIVGDPAAGHAFGAAVSLSALTLAAGAPGDDDIGSESGAAYIFGRDEGGPNNWGETVKLLPDSAASRFGSALAIEGDTLVVGAPGDRSPGVDTGAAYVFERNRGGPNTWGLTRKLSASDPRTGAEFGASVATSGGTIVVGAPRHSGAGNAAGAAYLFERNQGGTDNWGEARKLVPHDAGVSNNFGRAVAIIADLVAIGAPAEDSQTIPGGVYVFQRGQGGPNQWEQIRELQGSASGPGDQFGRSVSINSPYLVVGSPGESRAGDQAGVVYSFARQATGVDSWLETQILSGTDTSAGFRLGSVVGLSGTTILAGAPGDRHAGQDSGSAYVFDAVVQGARLGMQRQSPTTARISWSPATPGLVLQSTPSLAAPAWNNVAGQSNGIVITTASPMQFYRLSGGPRASIVFVPIGNPGNASDTGGFGGLGNGYQMGRYEVTNDEYVQFLNAVAAMADPFNLYNASMASDPRGGITRAGSAGAFSYASKPSFGNKPVNFVSFYDTLRFANWLHNGQPQGLQASSSTEDGAYTFAGPNTVGVRNAGAKAWLPSEDEWYKAAYYDPAKGSNGGYWRYPTRRDETPALATTDANGTIINDANNVANYAFSAEWNGQIGHVSAVGSAGTGSYSYYGVADLGGNVAEWNESSNGLSRGVRGGSWADFESALESVGTASQSPLTEVDTVGFRVARP